MTKRKSIQPTYDSVKDGKQYIISTSVNHRPIGEHELSDPFISPHRVRVSLLDTFKGLLKGGVEVQVRIRGKTPQIEEDVMELDNQYLGMNCTRRDEFNESIMHSMDQMVAVPKGEES